MSLQTGSSRGYAFDWAFGELLGRDLERTTSTCSLARLRRAGDGDRARRQLPARVLDRVSGRPLEEPPPAAIIAPFFVTYLIRTLAWQTILSDSGFVSTLRDRRSLGDGGRLLATLVAVVAGITYNFLPFMALPLYVALEQIDPRLIEAAQDLYANS